MKNKTFDCVEMKNRLQAEMMEREALLGPEEARRKRQQWLATGDDELANCGDPLRPCGSRKKSLWPWVRIRHPTVPLIRRPRHE